MSRTLVLFAKAPITGRVKTRIAKVAGRVNARRLYQKALNHMMCQLSQVAVDKRVLYVAPSQHPWLRTRARRMGWRVAVQSPGDLGQKMHTALRRELVDARRVVIVGADCVGLGTKQVAQAFDALENHPWVFVPADDGGYVLVGATLANARVFTTIRWGLPEVWSETQRRLTRHRLNYVMLPSAWDLDHWRDVKRFRHLLNGST